MSAPDPTELEMATLRAWAAAALERGRAAWPSLCVSAEELIRIAIAPQSERRSGADRLAVDELDAAEIYLAAACARGDPAALHALRDRYFAPVARALRRTGVAASQHEDVWQVLCERLLLSEAGAQPRIVRYAGAGALTSLMTIAAVRISLDWRAKERRHVSDDGRLSQLPATSSNPELHAIKRQHRRELKQELEAAVANLDARDRRMLRLHLVKRLGIDAIATLCSVHRATAARMVARAKDILARDLRARLMSRWRVANTDLPALMTLVDSHLDLSLPRLLA